MSNEQKVLTPAEALRALADGKKLQRAGWSKDVYIYLDADGVIKTYKATGTVYENMAGYSVYEEPFVLDFDWSCSPKWADQWIAMDADGEWFWYENGPKHRDDRWVNIDGTYSKIPETFQPKNFTGSWKDSLFENPKYIGTFPPQEDNLKLDQARAASVSTLMRAANKEQDK